MITIIDTSALITLYHLKSIHFLNQIFNEVYIPITVEEQFLSVDPDNRLNFLLNFYEENKWFKKCQTYHADIIAILATNKKIDEGEREAIAQYKQIQQDLEVEEGYISCILDEKDARGVATNMNVKLNGTLYLLAKLHLMGYFDYNEVEKIRIERRYSRKLIDAAMQKAKQELGI